MRGFKFIKVLLLVSLIALLVVGSGQSFAQSSASETYVIQAGSGQGNYRAFAPAVVRVHSGDTVRWITRGCNIHFADGETPMWLPGEYEGSPVLNSNPAVTVGNIQSGDSYTGGEANSGFPFGPPEPFLELKIDADTGTYSYYCDMYPGMVRVIEVVDAATPIPTPADVVAQGIDEIEAGIGALQQVVIAAMDAPAQTTEDGVIVTVGLNSGRAQTLDFFPNAVVIEAGQTVTWIVPENLMAELGVGVSSLPIGFSRFDGEPAPPPFTFIPPDGETPPSIRVSIGAANPPSGSNRYGSTRVCSGRLYLVAIASSPFQTKRPAPAKVIRQEQGAYYTMLPSPAQWYRHLRGQAGRSGPTLRPVAKQSWLTYCQCTVFRAVVQRYAAGFLRV